MAVLRVDAPTGGVAADLGALGALAGREDQQHDPDDLAVGFEQIAEFG